MLLLHPLNILKPLIEIVLPRVILFVLRDPAEALGARVRQVALNLFVVGVSWALRCDFKLDDVATHAQWELTLCRVLLLLDLTSCRRRLHHAQLIIDLVVVRQDLIDQVV